MCKMQLLQQGSTRLSKAAPEDAELAKRERAQNLSRVRRECRKRFLVLIFPFLFLLEARGLKHGGSRTAVELLVSSFSDESRMGHVF